MRCSPALSSSVDVVALACVLLAGCSSQPEQPNACVGACVIDGGSTDGSSTDGGSTDGGDDRADAALAPCQQTPELAGGTCRSGGECAAGLACFPNVAPESLFSLCSVAETPSACRDPATGELVLGCACVPVRFFPGGMCSAPCRPGPDDGCVACATCSRTIGGSRRFAELGVDVGLFDFLEPRMITADLPGLCRAHCTFDPASNGGCAPGYSCDVAENVCLERCVSDTQCALTLAPHREAGVVAVLHEQARCNPVTGRCD